MVEELILDHQLHQVQDYTATGGVISDYNTPPGTDVYRAHIFTSSGALNVTALSNDPDFPNTAEYLVSWLVAVAVGIW